MPMKLGGKGHNQEYDPKTGKWTRGASDEDKEDEVDNDKKEVKDDKPKTSIEDKLKGKGKTKIKSGYDVIQELIDDEIEAIEGYDNAIEMLKDEKIVEILNTIKYDEKEHLSILQHLQKSFKK